jgi:diguanylate cyclase (GGDEF)-like protein
VLLTIDLDKFGQINKDPRLGFAVGNEALAEIGRRLRKQMRTTDFASRLGGDEFAAFFPGAFDDTIAMNLARRIERAIRQPIVTSAGLIDLGASIGVVILQAGRAVPDVDTLMHSTDHAMQDQKRAGGGIRLVDLDT